MPRTQGSDELFKLIHSLTTNEKGYFVKYAKRHSGKVNDYLKLFTAISKQTKYNEAELKRNFKDLPVLKNYLFNMIVQSIISSGSGALPIDNLLHGLLQVNVLSRKGLTDKALKLISDHKKVAEEKEYYEWLASLIKAESNLLRSKWNPRERLVLSKKFDSEMQTAVAKQQQVDAFMLQQYIGLSLQNIASFNDEEVSAKDEMNLALLKSSDNMLSPLANRVRLAALHFYYKLEGDEQSAYKVCETIYNFEKSKWLNSKASKDPTDYFISASILMDSCFETNRISNSESIYDELKKLNTLNTPLHEKFQIRMTGLSLLILWFRGEHIQGQKYCQQLFTKAEFLSRNVSLWSYSLDVFSCKALFEFSIGDYTEALKTLNYFNNPDLKSLSIVHKKSAEFLRIIIQMEIGNSDLLPSITKSAKTRFKELTKQESALLSLIGRSKGSSLQLYNEIEKLLPSLRIFDLLEIIDLIASKKKSESLSEILARKVKAKKSFSPAFFYK
jgi:hypothetical protein